MNSAEPLYTVTARRFDLLKMDLHLYIYLVLSWILK